MRKYFLSVAILITVVITVGSLISVQKHPLEQVQNSDKLIHIIAYAILSISWFLSFTSKNPRTSFLTGILIGCFIFVYGIVIEVFQSIMTSYRQADWYDLFANFVGILIAFILFYFILTLHTI